MENNSTDTTTASGSEPASPDVLVPAAGRAFFYLVRSSDGVTEGSFGAGTGGEERIPGFGGCPREGEAPPQVTILRPGQPAVEDVLSLRLVVSSSDWVVEGTAMVGPLELEASGVDGGTFTVRYAGGAALSDGGGPLVDRAIQDDGLDPTTLSLTGVRYPGEDESAGTMLEVEVRNPRGVAASATVALNVDANPPSAPAGFSIDRIAYLGNGGQRSGESDLAWDPSTDDAAGGGPVLQYEIRAMCQTRSSCQEADWTPIDVWESRQLIATPDGVLGNFHLDLIGLDEDWRIGIRAFDEADNWSSVAEVGLSTRLTRTTLGSHSGLATSTPVGLVALGDVNGDDRDDIAVASYGSVTLLLGEIDPSMPVIPGNPFSLPPPGEPTYFGSDLYPAGDVNGDGIRDFVIGSVAVGPQGENRVYLYFGTHDLAELVIPDVAIQGPLDGTFTGLGYSRSGRGNVIDIGGGGPFDDLLVSIWGAETSLYLVLGRAPGQWPGTLEIATGPSQVASNCVNDIITIPGRNPPPGAQSLGFGAMTGITTLDGDDWADLIASTSYGAPGALPSTQYVFRGGATADCPIGYDLGAADEIVVNPPGAPGAMQPPIAALPTRWIGGVITDRGLEYAVGLPELDLAQLYRFDPLQGLTTAYQAITGDDPQEESFGSSLTYVGNMDQDSAGGIDLAVGAPWNGINTPRAGRVYLLVSVDADPRFPPLASLSLDVSGATGGFGSFLAGGLDYDGDGYPDLAAADLESTTIYLFH